MPPDRTRRWRAAAALCCWCLLAAIAATAPLATQGLSGRVTVMGAAVADAEIQVTNRQTEATVTVRTDANGRYSLPNLPPGRYLVRVMVSGFRTSTREVELTANQGAVVSMDLSTTGTGAKKGGGKQGAPQPRPMPIPTSPPPPPKPADQPRITGREFLPKNGSEASGYGLYSYLLFGARPIESTRARYLECLRAYLRLSEAGDLAQSVPPSRLNVTYLPVIAKPGSLAAEKLIEDGAYDYARAAGLLAKIPNGVYTQGPYIVSTSRPLTSVAAVTDPYLFQDLSSVPPEIVVLWVQEFINQAAQPEFWRKRGGPNAALELRTAIATLAEGVDPARRSLKDWQSLLATLLFWKGDEKSAGH